MAPSQPPATFPGQGGGGGGVGVGGVKGDVMAPCRRDAAVGPGRAGPESAGPRALVGRDSAQRGRRCAAAREGGRALRRAGRAAARVRASTARPSGPEFRPRGGGLDRGGCSCARVARGPTPEGLARAYVPDSLPPGAAPIRGRSCLTPWPGLGPRALAPPAGGCFSDPSDGRPPSAAGRAAVSGPDHRRRRRRRRRRGGFSAGSWTWRCGTPSCAPRRRRGAPPSAARGILPIRREGSLWGPRRSVRPPQTSKEGAGGRGGQPIRHKRVGGASGHGGSRRRRRGPSLVGVVEWAKAGEGGVL